VRGFLLRERIAWSIVVGALIASLCVTGSALASGGQHALPTRAVPAQPSPGADGTLGVAARRAISQGYLVPDERDYRRAKVRAKAEHRGQPATGGAEASGAGSPPRGPRGGGGKPAGGAPAGGPRA
jgi:hypothetical protein